MLGNWFDELRKCLRGLIPVFLTRYQEGLRKRRKPDEMPFLSTEDENV